jgi:hypothetical protein
MTHFLKAISLFLLTAATSLPALADIPATTDPSKLFTLSSQSDISAIADSDNGASLTLYNQDGKQGLKVDYVASQGYPGFSLKEPDGGRNLSAFKGVDVEIINVGKTLANIAVRVDNNGDWTKNAWNSEHAQVAPGDTITIHVTFGISYGQTGYPLDPSHVSAIRVFAITPGDAGTFVVSSIRGTP